MTLLLPRLNSDYVLKKFSYKHDMGRVCLLALKTENQEKECHQTFSVMKPGLPQGADYILTVLPEQFFINASGRLIEVKNRLRLFNEQKNESILCYDDNHLAEYHQFRQNCGALAGGCGLKILECAYIPKESLRKEG